MIEHLLRLVKIAPTNNDGEAERTIGKRSVRHRRLRMMRGRLQVCQILSCAGTRATSVIGPALPRKTAARPL